MAEKKKPERRKSALTGLSPVAPLSAEQTAPPAPAPAPAKADAKTDEGEKKKWPPKASFYQDPEDAGRMRAAFVNTMVTEDGTASLSEFIVKAVAKEVERLEAEYNNGKPWPAVTPRQIPKGPPRRWTS